MYYQGYLIRIAREGRTMFEAFSVRLTDDKSYPKYIQLRDQLAEFIKANDIASGEQLPDIVSMCRIAGLSNRSVERAYMMLINDGICFRRPKKGTFVRGAVSPHHGGVRPRICAIFSRYDPMRFEKDDVTGRIYAGIQGEARRAGIDLLILSERSLPFYLDNGSFDLVGIVMLSWYDFKEAHAVVSRYPGVRFLFVNYHFAGFENMPPNAGGIFNDDFAGGFEAAEYLIGRGCRKPRAITVRLDSDDNYQRRLDGFLLSARLNRLDVTERDICVCNRGTNPAKEDQIAMGHEFLRQILDDAPDTDAVFCTNDLLAAGAASALDKLGRRDRVEVTGYDNILPHLSADGRFTTVSINLEQMGSRAITQLLDGGAVYPRVVNVAPQLLPRRPSPEA